MIWLLAYLHLNATLAAAVVAADYFENNLERPAVVAVAAALVVVFLPYLILLNRALSK